MLPFGGEKAKLEPGSLGEALVQRRARGGPRGLAVGVCPWLLSGEKSRASRDSGWGGDPCAPLSSDLGAAGAAPALLRAPPAWRAVGGVHSVSGGFLELVRGWGGGVGGSSQKETSEVSSSSDIGGAGCRLPCRKFSGNLRAAGGVRGAEALRASEPAQTRRPRLSGAGVLVRTQGS